MLAFIDRPSPGCTIVRAKVCLVHSISALEISDYADKFWELSIVNG